MVSTYFSYDLIHRDMRASLQRVSDEAIVARQTAYYKENIGKVSTVDEFLDDYQLYSYAMKAFGLEDMTYAVAFMRKVLESDLNDDNSFANKLTDERYREFAAAFNFSTTTATVQTDAQLDEMIGLYGQTITDADEAVEEETRYYNVMMGNITSVDQLLGNERLRSYVFTAYGIDEKTYSREMVRNVLTSDPADPASYINTVTKPQLDTIKTQLADAQEALKDEDLTAAEKAALYQKISSYQNSIATLNAYVDLAATYDFNADGSVPASGRAQSEEMAKHVNELYILSASRVSSSAAKLNKEYFEEKIGSITTVSELVNDSRMLSYIRTAFDLTGVTIVKATIENILTSDPDDPDSYINKFGKGNKDFLALRMAFNFQTDGTLAAGDTAQTQTQTATTSGRYMSRYDDKDVEADEKALTLFKADMMSVTSVADFMESDAVYNYALKAVGLDPATANPRTIKQVLQSDLSNPKSYVYTLKDERYVTLATLFNFTADGSAGAPLLAQAELDVQSTAKEYIVAKSAFGTEDDKKLAEAEAEYYSSEIQKVKSLADLLAEPRLLAFVMTAHDIDPASVDLKTLYDIFTSDLDDRDSFINSEADPKFRSLVASFNFDQEGNLVRTDTEGVQTKRGLYEALDNYIRQTLEEEAGNDNQGVRLALYFERKGMEITSYYDILADTALQEFINVTYGIPDEMSGADVDMQVKMMERYFDIEDFQDPQKLKKVIERFTVMYDTTYNVTYDPILAIFDSSGSAGVSADTLLAMAQLKSG
ncbi:DUF1217 domain-containing protein [Rhizobiaceae bacterium n13]|uniref:DUF1217 domain-containing protein n=1 Tax=Ferirhizobium litorale TaxID=2927786 RepID=A0AAE3U1I2_9HYPH|nr:DUF1217 domain-containing protein [Fererhizobium litorale]MDI7861481.1 DUF1217 domain-containing protein [Fererhizobium litorale]MDI7921627.1 DUF1217 domain-containing protein [Fererhizobium litorale]